MLTPVFSASLSKAKTYVTALTFIEISYQLDYRRRQDKAKLISS